MNFEGKTILVTGGTGSFGRTFIRILLNKYSPMKIIVFSRDELKQHDMKNDGFSSSKMRYFLGDVRDKDRLYRAFQDVDIVVHAAALKQVPAAEYNPMEFVKTNVLGAQNIIDAALDSGVKKVVALSTDKATAPLNLYGATKLCSDKLFVAANNLKGWKDIKFAVVRYGNVMGSRGSVIPLFQKMRSTGVLPITNKEMTRFNITLDDCVNMVLFAIENLWGGEIFIPKIPSFKITDMAKAIAPECKTEIIGIRPGEKIHEEMITTADSYYTLDLGNYYVICPQGGTWTIDEFIKEFKAERVPNNFNYSSINNSEWLSVTDLRNLINKHLNNQNIDK